MKVKQKALDEVNEITYDTKTGITTTLVHTFKPCIDLFDGNEHIAHYKNDTEFIEDFKKMKQENQSLKKQLEYLRSGEYYNQLRFERDMLQNVVDNGEVSKEDKEFIDMTHRNTELLNENQELKKQLEENKDNYNCLLKQKEQFEYIMSKQVDYQGQRKEFINYLEDKIKSYKSRDSYMVADILGSYDLNNIELELVEEILQKCKEIIGVSDENNMEKSK